MQPDTLFEMDRNMIHIPFLRDWKDKMVSGQKTCTCRTKAYGKAGDYFRIFDMTFRLINVTKMALRDVADKLYREEGCASPQEFMDVYTSLHPRRKFQDTDMRFVHYFERVDL